MKLINYAYLRTETDISQNVDDKFLDNPIKRAQDQVLFMLGNAFYAEILSQYEANTLTTDNQAFYDPYIKKFMAWQAYEYWLTKANVMETRTGIRAFVEEGSEIASDATMGSLLRMTKQWTQYYKGELLSFLQNAQTNNSSIYPLYDRSCKNQLSGGFHITAISKRDNTYLKIDKTIFNSGN
ncbi:MAG TPA: hypothetical protein VFD46_08090 [Chryseolinea sp.]|nr:hypothetical protein [Chryseolinea sp.]